MRILPGSARVRVFEPDPAAPSGALPIFGEALDKLGRRVKWNIALYGVMILPSAWLFFLGARPPLPVFALAFFGSYLAFWIYCGVTGVPPRRLKSTPFRLVDLGEDDLVLAGKTVGIRLPDGHWLHIRLPLAWRLQLTRQRRIWLLGDGDRAFALLPGNLSLQRGRVVDTPPPGAIPLPPVSPEPASPRHDVVLGAHRKFLSRVLWMTSAFFGILCVLGVWFRLDTDSAQAMSVVATAMVVATGSYFLVLMLLAADHGKPLTADNWTELRLVPDGPMRIKGRGLARLSGRTMLADGREIGVRIVKVDPSLAANIAVTGQLWVVGMPKSRTVTIGVPGYPVTGKARLAQ